MVEGRLGCCDYVGKPAGVLSRVWVLHEIPHRRISRTFDSFGTLVANPSAIVSYVSVVTTRPSCHDRAYAGACAATNDS